MVDPVILQALWRGLKHLQSETWVCSREERPAGFGGGLKRKQQLEENLGWWQEAKKSPKGLRARPGTLCLDPATLQPPPARGWVQGCPHP